MSAPRTMFEKIWDAHVVHQDDGAPAILSIDLHLVHEVTSPQAFAGLAKRGLKVRRPDRTFATMDHSVPTVARKGDDNAAVLKVLDDAGRAQLDTLSRNCQQHGIRLYGLPTGYEFGSLIDAIMDVSKGDSGLSPATRTALASLERDVHLQVFSTPT